MIDELEKICREMAVDLIANNASTITQELKENPEGKMSVAIGFKLRLVASKLYLNGTLAYSRKFMDENESSIDLDDPAQPRLPGVDKDKCTVTFKAAGHEEVTMPLKTFEKAVDTIKAKQEKVE
jgi:hypothetical protein